jgi:protein-tyrosine phosphatase
MNLTQRFAEWSASLFLNRVGDEPESALCFWQTDLHSHLIPGVDDGVTDPEQTVVCLRQFAEWGIKRVITTPHISQDWYPNRHETLLAGQIALQQLIRDHQLDIIIEVAAEYLVDDLFIQLLDAHALLTFGQDRYVLIETGWASAPVFLETILFQMQTKGYQPVLAHPERYTYYNDDLNALAKLRDQGCLFQLNWGALTGRYGSKVQRQARRLLKNKWADFIGSDLHHPRELASLQKLFTQSDYNVLRQQPLRNQSLNQ